MCGEVRGHPVHLPGSDFIGDTQPLSKHMTLSAYPEWALDCKFATGFRTSNSCAAPEPRVSGSLRHAAVKLSAAAVSLREELALSHPACTPTAPHWSRRIEASLSTTPWQRECEEYHPSRGCSPC